jgi:hypothetical protein
MSKVEEVYQKIVDYLPLKTKEGKVNWKFNKNKKTYSFNFPSGKIELGGLSEPILKIYNSDNELKYNHRFIGDQKKSVEYLSLYKFLENKRKKEDGVIEDLLNFLRAK